MIFRITEDREPIITKVKGIALNFQAPLKGIGAETSVGLVWQANFDHIDLDGKFELWLTCAEIRQLIARLQTAIGETTSERV